jgi:hypothetical protein
MNQSQPGQTLHFGFRVAGKFEGFAIAELDSSVLDDNNRLAAIFNDGPVQLFGGLLASHVESGFPLRLYESRI